MSMFCFQCEQTAKGTGCAVHGVCGKEPEAACLMDLLVDATKAIARYTHRAGQLGRRSRELDVFVIKALFATVTNVDFDTARLNELLAQAGNVKIAARKMYEEAAAAAGKTPEIFEDPVERKIAENVGILKRREKLGEDISSLQELVLYGLKGAAAYMDHAHVLGKEDDAVYALFSEALDYLAGDNPTVDGLVGWALKAGELNFKVMELLDAANTGTYGHPVPTPVRVTPVQGKCILVTGHDLKDLYDLLVQTEGTGIHVYTHGEMLPCHAYPKLKAFKHLVGNFGGAWQDQQKEFEGFPGAILFTTNCIQKPRESYIDRVFTTGLVGFHGVKHVKNGDFREVIEKALALPGFAADEPAKEILTGFGRNAVLGVADKVIDAVKAGKIRRFFLVGGCDGAKPGRNYYTDFAMAVPRDCVILTLACGKYRFNKLEFGDIDGIPRLLDIGQCNDAYSAIQIALALANAFNCGVNDLPLSLVLSWYEQKAVAILLTLLYLGVRDIRIGPSLPAFITPAVLQVLVDKYGIKPITTPEQDLKAILG